MFYGLALVAALPLLVGWLYSRKENPKDCSKFEAITRTQGKTCYDYKLYVGSIHRNQMK